MDSNKMSNTMGSVSLDALATIVTGLLREGIASDAFPCAALLDRLTRNLVFTPLGMHATGYVPVRPAREPNSAGSIFAATEQDEETGCRLHGIVHDENARFLGGVSGNAGVFSTLDDCVCFAGMLAGKGTLEGTPFLSEHLFALAIRNQTAGMAESRGLGASLFDGRLLSCGDLFPIGSIGHTGFTGTSLWVDMHSGLHVVLLTNAIYNGRERTSFFRLRRRIHNVIAGGLA